MCNLGIQLQTFFDLSIQKLMKCVKSVIRIITKLYLIIQFVGNIIATLTRTSDEGGKLHK